MYRGAAVAVALLACASAALAQTWPSIPAQYSAVVSANVVETGYTLSFSEYWDGTRLRVDGRYVPTYYAQIWDFGARMITQWQTNDVYTCSLIDFSGAVWDQFLPRLRDSLTQWWSPSVPPTFVGYSTAARTINCALWSAPDVVVGPGFNETATEYFYLRATDNVPVRMERIGTRWTQNATDGTWSASDLHEYVDWVMFIPGAPESRWFSKPSACPSTASPNPSFPFVQPPTVSTVTPQPADMGSPLMPSAFRLVLESKLTTTSQTVTSMRWYLDMGKNKERLDYVGDGGKLVQLVYDYSQTPNLLWNATLDGTCVTSYADAANASPMYARAGALPALFKRYGWFMKPPARYEGRVAARGVASDSFVQRQQLVNDYSGAVFDFDMHVLFFPQGWQFPGREGVDPATALAIRISNNGTMKPKTGANQTFSDVWDIFQLIPTEQDPTLFAATSMWGCAALPPQPEESHGTSNAGTIAGAIIGVVLGLALIYGAYRWWRSHRGTFHANIQGMAKADDTATTSSAAQP